MLSKEFINNLNKAISKRNETLRTVEDTYGTILFKDNKVNWNNVYYADKGGMREQLYELGFDDKELKMAEAYHRLYVNGYILSDNSVDLEHATRKHSKECLAVGVDEQVVKEWVAYWKSQDN